MVKTKKLLSGITVVMEKTEFLNSAVVGVWVKTGAADETDEISGVSHFIEHMMFKGTFNRTAKKLAEDVDKIGGYFNAFTGKEATCYYIKTLSSNIYKGVEIICDMLTNSKFDYEEMDKERKVICEEIKMVSDSPDEDIFDQISELVSSGNPLGRSILGTEESLKRIDREKLTSYLKNKYTKDNTVITIVGNFDEDRICEALERYFDKYKDKKTINELTLNPYKQNFKSKKRDIEQSHICMAIPTVSLGDDKYYSFTLLNNIFGGSMSSRLFQKIREEKGLAYSVSSMNSFGSYAGFFAIYAGISNDKVEDALEEIKKELYNLYKKGISNEELQTAKEQVKSMYIFGLENPNSRMFSLGKNKLLLDQIYTQEEILNGYNKVSIDEIDKSIEMIADYSSYSAAVISNSEIDIERMIKNGN